ncbi:MAG TPA: cupin domain-containing protein [Pseudonocardiaceae bacterium]|jgi:quercetin dioxygenase-like cupin family protein|nr:cupin domain-containing protein [Pseudonocardiaceae bacterium]
MSTHGPDPEQPISREVLLDAQLEQAKNTQHVEVRRITIAPGHGVGVHVHNGPVVGSIVRGSVVFQVDGEPESVLRPGDVFFEPEGARILRFDARDDGVTFLGYFLLSAGQQPDISYPDR